MTRASHIDASSETLLLFVRFPEAGRVKTRLIPALGGVGAAELYRRMASEVARRVEGMDRPGLRRIALVEPPSRRAAVQQWLGKVFTTRPQAPGDLGERLGEAFAAAFEQGAARVVAAGTDCLDLTGELLIHAFDALERVDAVIGPAVDGGYYLIGLRRSIRAVFQDIPWSTDRTLRATRDRLQAAGASVHLLRTLRDLDTEEDLAVLAARWNGVLAPLVDAGERGAP